MILDLTVSGDERATEHVRGIARRAGNLEPLFTLMAADVMRSERRKFAKGWTKSELVGFKRHTVTRGKRKGEKTIRDVRAVTHYTLVDSGSLRKSLVSLASPENVLHPSRDSLEFGTSVFYAKFLRKQGFSLVPVNKQLRSELADTAMHYFLPGAA